MREFFCAVDWERLVRILAALLTPTIAIVTAYIAYQQYQTNWRQHRLALFEKRLAIFNKTMDSLAAILQHIQVELDQLFALLRETRDHEFLFGPEVGDFINEVYKKGVEMNARAQVPGQHEQMVEISNWFSGQMGVAREKFRKYLDFQKP